MTAKQKNMVTSFLSRAAIIGAATAYVVSADAGIKDWVIDRDYARKGDVLEVKSDWLREIKLLREEIRHNRNILERLFRRP